ncbi:GTP-binding protein 2 [Diplogelasinospora grovesii]|uniref:GTP-binding protein 2 n=1 Tax=Diplogelasinospora grovesii TaxID=303347 RepID=A0AAN6N169_9PEZI|nr:GTP-binding protein 2 [Diplogelasinospora grovesii]
MSVFTFDPDPPRVASPWLRPADSGKKPAATARSSRPSESVPLGLLSDYGVTKLEAEPQEGPTEYKLHLLLRPRRRYEKMSTTDRISGSTQTRPPSDARSSGLASTPVGPSTPSSQTRQDRLEHLTTQLLWRLQQSCPYHASSAASELVIPQLPDEGIAPNGQVKIGKLLPGLEASRGALYEIGVADDGTLVGLTKEEMDESLATLRVMAASLGCNMKVLRMVVVGDCEWVESSGPEEQVGLSSEAIRHQSKLWVAEAFITPELQPRDATQKSAPVRPHPFSRPTEEALPDPKQGPLTTDQLRVTLTGPTTSGKSTILGTLSSGTLDNGRGKSRLSLLKHRHEVASGITSSVAQELIGYHGGDIINYGHSGVESWIDIHDFTKDGRLVYLLDSAGHPRFRRTILRGVVGWAPHWTLLCIAADGTDSAPGFGAVSSSPDSPGTVGQGVDLASAYLDLCLRLGLPLAIVVTKLDLANKASVLDTLRKLLSGIKNAGRVPKILQQDPASATDFGHVSAKDRETVEKTVDVMVEQGNLLDVVPIVLTSAVDGRGVSLLHALLQSLPLPPRPTSLDYTGPALNPEQPTCLFHIEDRFSLPASYSLATSAADQEIDLGTVVAGYLRFGSLSIGDRVVVGPFPPEDDESRGPTPDDKQLSGSYGLSTSHPSSAELGRIAARNAVSASAIKGEWHHASIVSIRNLRLPVQTLAAGQVGSIGMIFEPPKRENPDGSVEVLAPSVPRIRKGMVLAVPSQHMAAGGLSLQAASGLTAVFDNPEASSLTVGSLVNIYIASVRSPARVVSVSRTGRAQDASAMPTEDIDDVFNLNEEMDTSDVQAATTAAASQSHVQLELLTTREWIELGAPILILEGGSKDKSGLEGFVGKVVEIVD